MLSILFTVTVASMYIHIYLLFLLFFFHFVFLSPLVPLSPFSECEVVVFAIGYVKGCVQGCVSSHTVSYMQYV